MRAFIVGFSTCNWRLDFFFNSICSNLQVINQVCTILLFVFLQFRGHGLFHLNFILLAMFINCMTWNNWNKGIKITNQNHFQIIRKQEASSCLLLLFIASHIVYNIWRCLRYLPAERHWLNVCAAFEIKIEVWIEIAYQIYFDFNNYHNNPNKIYFLNHKTKTKRNNNNSGVSFKNSPFDVFYFHCYL